MNRVIKFRCWSESYKKYLEDMQYPNGHSMLWIFASDGTPYHIEVGFDGLESTPLHLKIGEVVLEQFTGLTDKNGNEIYEGDIIEIRNVHKDWEGENGVVVFNDGAFQIKYESNTAFYGWICSFVKIMYDSKKAGIVPDIHVIGNIHEHKNLLDAQK